MVPLFTETILILYLLLSYTSLRSNTVRWENVALILMIWLVKNAPAKNLTKCNYHFLYHKAFKLFSLN